MISEEFVGKIKSWRHSGFHAFAGEEIPDIDTAVRVGPYMVRGPAATTRLQADPGAEPKLRYLAIGSVPDQGNDAVSDGHREYDYLDRRSPEVRNRLAQGAPKVVGPADPSRLRGRPTALPMRSADARGRVHHAGAGDSQDSGPRRSALRAAGSSQPRDVEKENSYLRVRVVRLARFPSGRRCSWTPTPAGVEMRDYSGHVSFPLVAPIGAMSGGSNHSGVAPVDPK